jgi:hypothetical protein
LLLVAFAALTLTFFSLFGIGLYPGLHVSFRQQAVWQSGETLRITQPVPEPTIGPGPIPRMPSLADYYSRLAESPAIRALLKGGPLSGRYEVAPLENTGGPPLPFLRIDGKAGSPAQASRIAARVSRALRAYIARAQATARISPMQRVRLEPVEAPQQPRLIQSHWRKGPLVALSIVMAALLLAAGVKFADERR